MPHSYRYTGRIFDWSDLKWVELLTDTPIAWGRLKDGTTVDLAPHGDRWAEIEEVLEEQPCLGAPDQTFCFSVSLESVC